MASSYKQHIIGISSQTRTQNSSQIRSRDVGQLKQTEQCFESITVSQP